MALFLAQAEDVFSGLIWILFFLAPLLIRLFGWLRSRLLGEKDEVAESDPSAQSEPMEDEVEREEEADQELGSEMWRRLMGGDEAATPVVLEPAPLPPELTRVPAPAPSPRARERSDPLPSEPAFDSPSSPQGPEPSRFADLPTELDMTAAGEASLVRSADPESRLEGMVMGKGWDDAWFPAIDEASTGVGPEGLRNAVLWAVILAPPPGLDPHGGSVAEA